MPAFRIDAKNFSLTYPQCTASKEAVLDFLQTMSPNYICVSKEQHADGNPHIHAAISFETKKNLRNERYFDFNEFHPNIQSTRNMDQWINYIKKGGDFIEIGTFAGSSRTRSNIKLSDIPTSDLRDFCVNNNIGFGYYQEEKRARSEVDTTVNNEPNLGTMTWYLQLLQLPETKSIILTGTTGIGKTTWALSRSPKPALLVSHMDQLKKFNPTIHKSIIFDDMNFQHLPVTAQIHLVDNDQSRAIHVRYGIVTIPHGITKIFTCNEYPFTYHEAIERRTKHINANNTIIE